MITIKSYESITKAILSAQEKAERLYAELDYRWRLAGHCEDKDAVRVFSEASAAAEELVKELKAARDAAYHEYMETPGIVTVHGETLHELKEALRPLRLEEDDCFG